MSDQLGEVRQGVRDFLMARYASHVNDFVDEKSPHCSGDILLDCLTHEFEEVTADDMTAEECLSEAQLMIENMISDLQELAAGLRTPTPELLALKRAEAAKKVADELREESVLHDLPPVSPAKKKSAPLL